MSTGEVRALVDQALLVIDDQLEALGPHFDAMTSLHGRLASALAGSSQPDAELFLAHVAAMATGLQSAMTGAALAGAPGQRLIHNLS